MFKVMSEKDCKQISDCEEIEKAIRGAKLSKDDLINILRYKIYHFNSQDMKESLKEVKELKERYRR